MAEEMRENLMTKKATFIRKLKGTWKGDARLYKLSEPVAYENTNTDYVIVSAVVAFFSGPETYIFPADENGEILDWGELDGSLRGTLSHEEALENAGYEVV